MLDASQRLKFALEKRDRYYLLDPIGLPPEIRERLGWKKPVKVVFISPPPEDVENAVVLGRNHPLVAFLADRILGRAFLPTSAQDFARCGAAYTNAVKVRTVLALLRVDTAFVTTGSTDCGMHMEGVGAGGSGRGSSGDGKRISVPTMLSSRRANSRPRER
jgi:hypothetical protein